MLIIIMLITMILIKHLFCHGPDLVIQPSTPIEIMMLIIMMLIIMMLMIIMLIIMLIIIMLILCLDLSSFLPLPLPQTLFHITIDQICQIEPSILIEIMMLLIMLIMMLIIMMLIIMKLIMMLIIMLIIIKHLF